MAHPSAVIAACARNCEATLPAVLANIERMAGLYEKSVILFLENDSTDRTKLILREWCGARPNAKLIELDGLVAACPMRSPRLEKLRKTHLSLVRSHYADYRHLIVIDCDDVNLEELDLAQCERALAFLEADARAAGVFAAQDGPYYDLWALRHPALCPGDIWIEEFEYIVETGIGPPESFKQTVWKRLFALAQNAPPLEVDSAFGGLGIYKIPAVLANARSYRGHTLKYIPHDKGMIVVPWEVCEHVDFHLGLRELGHRLFVLPFLANAHSSKAAGGKGPGSKAFVGPNPMHNCNKGFDWKLLPLPGAMLAVDPSGYCPCGSGRWYRNCHGEPTRPPVSDRLRAILAQ